MIIKKLKIIPLRVRILSTVITIISFIIFLMLTLFTNIYSEKVDCNLSIATVIFAIISILPLGDFLLSVTRHKSLAIFIAKRICRSTDKRSLNLTDTQINFRAFVLKNVKQNKCRLSVSGHRGVGKSTAVLYLIENIFLYSDKSILGNDYEVVFINCLTNKEEISNYFKNELGLGHSPKIIFVDNAEELGEVFLNGYKSSFEYYNVTIVLIIDSTHNDHNISYPDKPEEYEFDSDIIAPDFECTLLGGVPDNEKDIFIVVYIICKINSLCKINVLWTHLGFEKGHVKRVIKRMCRNNFFHAIDSNCKLVYCCKHIPEEMLNLSVSFFNRLPQILKTNTPEVGGLLKWGLILHLPVELIERLGKTLIDEVFHNASGSGNYMFMYEALNNQPHEKSDLLEDQKAVLSFHMGYHSEAMQIYEHILCSTQNDEKYQTMLGIVEAMHGSCNDEIAHRIHEYLQQLYQKGDYFLWCAKYWELHIQTEQGKFEELSTVNLEETFLEIVRHLQQYSTIRVCSDIIQRCYTDCIRCYHILGLPIPESLKDEFKEYLKPFAKKYVYYSNLYIKANELHYICIPEMYSRRPFDDIKSLADEAKEHYTKAVDSGYGDKKSLLAANMKKCDLEMLYTNSDYSAIHDTIQYFEELASRQRVDVFVAYAQTLKIKWLITNPQNISNDCGLTFSNDVNEQIEKNYQNAVNCYKRYKNVYGEVRLHLLYSLYQILLNTGSKNVHINKISNILDEHPYLKREHLLIENTNWDSVQQIINTVRLYPIILQ